MTTRDQEDKRAYNYARDRLANDDYPVYNDEYELELAYKAGIEDAKNHPRWISVEDELPRENEWVLTFNGRVVNLLMLAGNGGWYDKAVGLHVNVTHWMALPNPPVLSTLGKTAKEVRRYEFIQYD